MRQVGIGCFVFLSFITALQAQEVTIQDLSVEQLHAPFSADSINDRGWAAVRARDGAFVWNNGLVQKIDTVVYAAPLKINNEGVVLGLSSIGDPPLSFIWEAGRTQVIDYAPVLHFWDINDSNRFVLGAQLWQWRDGAAAPVGTADGARDINKDGHILSRIAEAGGSVNVIIRGSESERFGGADTPAIALNDHGEAIGEVFEGPSRVGGYRYANGRIEALPVPAARSDWIARPLDINANGEIVGALFPPAAGQEVNTRAALWRRGDVVDLNELLPEESGWILLEARGINALGDIVGAGMFHSEVRPFLLRGATETTPPQPELIGDGSEGDREAGSAPPVIDEGAGGSGAPERAAPVNVRVRGNAALVDFTGIEGALFLLTLTRDGDAPIRAKTRKRDMRFRRLRSGNYSLSLAAKDQRGDEWRDASPVVHFRINRRLSA